MTIEQFIIDLLKKHNCVIVPNFGGFIANYQPAIIDNISKTVKPPSKQILFNDKLHKNDGLLANYIADKKLISYPESLVEIENKAKEWKTALACDKRLVFGEIGFLYEQDGAIVFEQNRETNLWLKAYGLSSIQFIPAKNIVDQKVEATIVSKPVEKIVQPKKIESPNISLANSEEIKIIALKKEEPIAAPTNTPKQSRKKWGYIAAACVLPFLFYTYWIPMETNFLETGNIQLSDFNPFQKNHSSSVYKKRTIINESDSAVFLETFDQKIEGLSNEVNVYHYQFDESIYMPVQLKKETTEIETSSKHITEVDVSTKEAPIQLIAGCFSVKKNALTLVSSLKNEGYSAYILDKNKGLYRVAVNGFQNMNAANSAKTDLKSKSYSTWILKQH